NSMRPAVNGPEVAATAVQKTVPVESAPPAAVPSQPVEQPLAAKDPAPAPSGKDKNNPAANTSVDNAASGNKDAVIPPSAPQAVTPAPVVVASSVRQSDAPVAAPVQNTPAPAPAAAQPTSAPTAGPAVRATPPVEKSVPPAPTVASAPVSAPTAALPVIAPRAIRREAPMIPAPLKRRINGAVNVTIQVDVDATGKVVRAVSLTKGDTLTNQISGLALEAARKWQFEAATQGGQKVPSQAKLEFRLQQ
ncbi:MAG: TonB family protein, partial [Bryobacteraceae bacterium]